MFTYVFVYSPSKFRVDGEHSLRRFKPGQLYTTVDPVIAGGEERVLAPGIYGIGSVADQRPELHAVEARSEVDYDQLGIADKDSWPTIVGEKSGLDPELRKRVRAAFPDLRDEDLRAFYEPRSA